MLAMLLLTLGLGLLGGADHHLQPVQGHPHPRLSTSPSHSSAVYSSRCVDDPSLDTLWAGLGVHWDEVVDRLTNFYVVK